MDPVPDPLLLRKSGSAGDRTRDLCICSQKLFCEVSKIFWAYAIYTKPVKTWKPLTKSEQRGTCSGPPKILSFVPSVEQKLGVSKTLSRRVDWATGCSKLVLQNVTEGLENPVNDKWRNLKRNKWDGGVEKLWPVVLIRDTPLLSPSLELKSIYIYIFCRLA